MLTVGYIANLTMRFNNRIYNLGDQCYLDFPIDAGLAGGIVLHNDKNIIVSCFGFKETKVQNTCLRWWKMSGRWGEPVEVVPSVSVRKIFDDLLEDNKQYFLYPTYTYCEGEVQNFVITYIP